MAHIAGERGRSRRGYRAARGLLALPLVVFVAVTLAAAAYVAYVLWPRWPDPPIARDGPATPIVIAGTAFIVQPAAIRMPVQRRPGIHERVDLAYLWPSLMPPDPALKPTPDNPINPNERLFVTIANGENTLPPMERVKTIYPRYLAANTTPGPGGLTLRAFRDTTPYQGEDLIFDAQAPERFLARCSRQGVGNSGVCLYELRIGNADVTLRFPRDWLDDAPALTKGFDRLIARLRPPEK